MSFFQNLALVLFIVYQVLSGISKAEEVPVAVGERVLIGVVDLHSMTQKKGLYPTLYRGEELLARKTMRRWGAPAYAHVSVLANEWASLDEFLGQLDAYEADPAIRAIDVVLYLHGHDSKTYGAPEICFFSLDGKCVQTSTIVSKFQKYTKLRMLYSDACYGSEQSNDWLQAGFKVVAGSTATDANLMMDLTRFLKVWTVGGNFESSIQFANSVKLGKWLDQQEKADSTKIINGNGLLKIDSPMR